MELKDVFKAARERTEYEYEKYSIKTKNVNMHMGKHLFKESELSKGFCVVCSKQKERHE